MRADAFRCLRSTSQNFSVRRVLLNCWGTLEKLWINFQVLVALLIKYSVGIGAHILNSLTPSILYEVGLVRLWAHWQIVERLIVLLDRGQIQISRLLVQIAGDYGGICVRHHKFWSTLLLNLACIWLNHGLAYQLVVINLKHTSFIGVMQGALEVFSDLFLSKLFLNTVNDWHNPFDIPVKNVTFLETLECDLALFGPAFVFFGFFREDWEPFLSDIVHNWWWSFIWRNVCGSGLTTLNIEESGIELGCGLSTWHTSSNQTLFGNSIRSVVTLQSAGTLEALRLRCTGFLVHFLLILLHLFVRILWLNLLVLSCRTQVAHSGDEVFHRLYRSIGLQVWLKALNGTLRSGVVLFVKFGCITTRVYNSGVLHTLMPIWLVLDRCVYPNFRRWHLSDLNFSCLGCGMFFIRWHIHIAIYSRFLHSLRVTAGGSI